ACLDPECMAVAIAVDALPLDVLEDQIRLPGRRYARIDEASNMRVGHLCEKIAFPPKPLCARASDQRDVQELDGRPSFKASVAPLGQPDTPHPALANLRDQQIGPQDLP